MLYGIMKFMGHVIWLYKVYGTCYMALYSLWDMLYGFIKFMGHVIWHYEVYGTCYMAL